MMPLGLLGPGETAEVLEVRGAEEKAACPTQRTGSVAGDLAGRIEDMGLRTGKVVEMVSNEGKGALLVRVDETRIAIARALAMNVMVRRRDDDSGTA